jgi:hypothetical protein
MLHMQSLLLCALTIASSATRISATSSAVPSAAGSKVSLPSMSASVSTTRPPVALAMRLQEHKYSQHSVTRNLQHNFAPGLCLPYSLIWCYRSAVKASTCHNPAHIGAWEAGTR